MRQRATDGNAPLLGRRGAMVLAAAALCSPRALRAQQAEPFPSRTVRIVTGFAAGGPTDLIARVLADKLSPVWRQPVVVENRVGAGGNIAAENVARATGDAHALLLATSAHVQTPPLIPRMPYDPLNDFTPLMKLAYYPLVLCVHPSVPARTLEEFIAYAKSRPAGEITMGSSGVGNTPHLTAALFGLEAGIEFTHVQYSGTATAQTALLSGEVRAMFQNPVLATQPVQAGLLRALATTGLTRWRALPDVPTVAERGYRGFEAGSWFGMLAPAGVPADRAGKLYTDIRAAVMLPDVRARLTASGFDLMDVGPDEFRAGMQEELAKWERVVRDARIST
jgi:tripartite-type tricarboxylate transporter receptor subunit TctC